MNNRYEQFAEILSNLAEYYRYEMSDSKLEFFIDGLRSFSAEDLKRAVREHARDLKRGKFMPTIADLLAYEEAPAASSNRDQTKIFCDKCPSLASFSAKRDTGGYLRLCADHYYEALPKTEQDLKREKIEKEFIAEAKKLGITNRDLFVLKNPKLAEVFCKNENMRNEKRADSNKAKPMKDYMNSG